MKYIMTVVAATVLCLAPLAARADKSFDVGEKLQKMKVSLGLNEQQEAAIKPILEEYKTKVETAGQEKEDRLKAVLSPEQMNQWDAFKKDMKKDDKE